MNKIKYYILIVGLILHFSSKAQNTVLQVKQTAVQAAGLNGLPSNLINSDDEFGISVQELGDINKDGITDVVIGAQGHDLGSNTDAGAVYTLMLNADGSVKKYVRITQGSGGFAGSLTKDDRFGHYLAKLNDYDKDTVSEVVIGSYQDNDGGTNRGAIYVCFIDTSGEVKRYKKISDTQGNFTATLDNDDKFGTSVSSIGDLDGDGVEDLIVGASGDDDGGTDRGCVYILFMDTTASVKRYKKISDTQGGFNGSLSNSDLFGYSVKNIGDLNGDGITDVAVGAPRDDDGGTDRGAFWILFLDTNGTVKKYSKVSSTLSNFNADINNGDWFGRYFAAPGDVNGDGVEDLFVGAHNNDDGGSDRGAIWLLYLTDDGLVSCYDKISSTEGNFKISLSNSDQFGVSLCELPDFDNNGVNDLIVGSRTYGTNDKGASFFISLENPDLKILTNSGTFCPGNLLDLDSKDGKYVNWYNSKNQLIATDSFKQVTLGANDTIFYLETGDFDANCKINDTLQITINKSIKVSFPNIEACGADAVNLGPDTIPNKFSFTWSTKNGLTDSTIANPYADLGTVSTFYVSYFDSTSNCSYSDSQTVVSGNCTGGNCGATKYIRAYGGNSNDAGTSILYQNGKMLIAGYTESRGNGGEDVLLMQVDENGDVDWLRTYGGTDDDRCNQLTLARNGDYFLLGTTKSYGGSDEDVYLLRVQPNGTIRWSKVLGGSSDDQGFGLLEMPNGEIVLHITSRSYTVNSGYSDGVVMTLSSNGNTIEAARKMGNQFNESSGSLVSAFNNKIIAVNSTQATSHIDGLISEINTDGTISWSNLYGGSGDDRFMHVIRTNDKKYAAVGFTTSFGAGNRDIYFVKFDTDGKVDFARAYGGTSDEFGYSLIQDKQGNYLITASTTSFGAGNT
ncbi:MAG: FG-GAP repeat protein, partial [Bacteroidetes bacterium]|nr:FG-GAP repeat protein [Bacteroidota bacterium]